MREQLWLKSQSRSSGTIRAGAQAQPTATPTTNVRTVHTHLHTVRMSRGTMVRGSGGVRYLRPELVADLWPNVSN